jgi:hypothetical protein
MSVDMNPDLEKEIIQRLDALQEVPPRSSKAALAGRAAFLSEARQIADAQALKAIRAEAQADAARRRRALPAWKPLRLALSPWLTAVLVILILALGAAPVTVYAAQSSLPNDLLYPVKMLTEDWRLNNASQASRLALALQFAERRVSEMTSLQAQANPIPEGVLARFEQHESLAMQTAAGLPNGELVQALERLQTHISAQEQLLTRVQNAGQPDDPVILQAQVVLQHHARLVEVGLRDPRDFRRHVSGAPLNSTPAPTADEPGGTPHPQESQVPGSGPGAQPGPLPAGPTDTAPGQLGPATGAPGATVTPGSSGSDTGGSGAGPGPAGTKTPAPDESGDQGGPNNSMRVNP